MDNTEEKYITNNEYTLEFRKKTVIAALVTAGVTAAVVLILIVLALKTDFMYYTDFFKINAMETVPIHAEKRVFSGDEYEFGVEDFIKEDGRITMTLNVRTDEAALNRLSEESFKLICYDYTGVVREEVISAASAEREMTDSSEGGKYCSYKLEFHKFIDESCADDICCLRINTGSADGIVSILCNYNTKP